MGKITILFIIVSSYLFIANSATFNGYCEPIVNEKVCIDKTFFENLTSPKSFQVIAHLKFSNVQGATMFHTYLKKNLIATISNEGGILFSINCFKIPADIKFQKHLNFQLKIKACNTLDADLKDANNINHELYNYTNKSPLITSIYKTDNYFTIWGCNTIAPHLTDRAAWILLDNDGQIEYDTKKLRVYLNDLLRKIKPLLKKIGLSQLNVDSFTVYNITNEYYSCYDELNKKSVFQYVMNDFPQKMSALNVSDKTIDLKDSTKLKITVALLMLIGHVLFMVGFFTIGYQIVIRCFKE
ncbi:unnamed protein product [Chironomus riparius]|uniref:Uncharacterized protein n=1 Tax=Chironomus riparius TaxID=315576 RepID=A0A9N9RZY8_9DIPT|nr:unnamed protein product [Chironomus riparius]